MVTRKINYLVVHHSGSPVATTTVAKIKKWHRERGFPTVGYHHIIDSSGTNSKVLSYDTEGCHVYGKNKDSIGICVMGNYANDIEKPTKAALEATEAILVKLCERFDVPPWCIVTHSAHAISGHHTLCPGKNLMSEMSGLIARVTTTIASHREPMDIHKEIADDVEEVFHRRTLWTHIKNVLSGLISFIKKKWKSVFPGAKNT